eukprot:gnl/Trimastix_PCT/4217.p1 GENE.gnl/Trimastix_PCT/4217~~gnl/Trimastix_PCT/4217.p1  ORF type:complete len:535 (+),score=120.31 gnl/Trimastix_PCT/4217:93-1607(+)
MDPKIDSPSETLDQLFSCLICYRRAHDAHLLPCCSKICCYKCAKRWLDQKAACPHCRAPLRSSQLVRCRFMAEITAEVDRLQQKKKTEEAPASELCAEHNAPIQYYCTTCRVPICADCAMFGNAHKGHAFERLSAVYEQHVAGLGEEVERVEAHLQGVEDLVAGVKANIDGLVKTQQERENAVKVTAETAVQRLHEQLREKCQSLNEQKHLMSEDAQGIRRTLREIQMQIHSAPQSVLIRHSSGLKERLRTVQSKSLSEYLRAPVDPIFDDTEIFPPFHSSTFIIHGFPALRDSPDSEILYSDPMNAFAGVSWRLKVYPNGNGVARGLYLSVFLEMVKGRPEQLKYEYQIELVNVRHPGRSISRSFSSDFEVNECWGYNRFAPLGALEKNGFYGPDLSLHLRFLVRSPSYPRLVSEFSGYVGALEQSNAALDQESVTMQAHIRALEEELRALRGDTEKSGGEAEEAEEEGVRAGEGSLLMLPEEVGATRAFWARSWRTSLRPRR